ncbi:MAG: chemotaxis protein CheA [Rhodanobacteraceae bacterium]
MSAAIDNEVLQAFLVEAGELLDALGDQLIALEAHPADGESLNPVFRAFHTVKGGAGFLAVRPMVELCHRAEELLDGARNQRLLLEPAHIDCLLQASDTLLEMIQALRNGEDVPPPPIELMHRLQPQSAADAAEAAAVEASAGVDDTSSGDGNGGDAIDDSEFEALLDSIYGKGGAPGVENPDASAGGNPPKAVIPGATHGDGPHDPIDAKDEKPASGQTQKHRADTTIRVDTGRIDALINAAGELALVRNRLANLTASGTNTEMERAVGNLDRVAGDLQAAALQMRMQPIGRLFQRFPRIVRDLARQLGKQVTLVQHGEDTSLDRILVESLADPLIHLLRNAIDHGLEDPDTREQAGKPRQGTVTLAAGQEGERIVIRIRDDGRGMDPEVLRKKAVEKGLITEAQSNQMDPAECHALIFRPGFSTRSEISDISGRGVGMDVVKTGIATLGGTIAIESTPGSGTTIHIAIPLTLAILRVLMVRVGDRQLALPLTNVLEVFELRKTEMRMLDGRVVAAHRGRPLPLSDLAAWAGVPTAADTRAHVVVVHVGHQQLGLLATQVLGREEVMIKPLGPRLRHLPGIAGATITGNGRVALVLDLVSLAESSLPQPLRMTA